MSNLGYVRFENTLSDLKDCFRHLNDATLSSEERAAREELVALCKDIVDECYTEEGDLIPFDDPEENDDDDEEEEDDDEDG